MKNLFIHIGMPKTGSSAIQAFLACNNEKLENVGYYYPWHPGFGQAFQTGAGNATNLHHWIIDGSFEELANRINELPYSNIILSSEVLFHTARLQPKKFAEALKPFNVKIICYIRKIDDLIDSCVNQLVKNHGVTDYNNLGEIINDHDYASTLISLSQFIDKKYIDVRIYDRTSFPNNNIYEDVLKALDLNEITNIDDFNTPNKTINPSLVPEAFEVRKHLNSINFNVSDEQIKYTFNGILAHYSVGVSAGKFSILTREQRQQVFALFGDREIQLNELFFEKQGRIFDKISSVEKPEVSNEKLGDVFYFIYKNNNELFYSIIDKISEATYSPLLVEIIKKFVLPNLADKDKVNILPSLNAPLISILPHNFSSLTHSYSKDMSFLDLKYATKITSKGNDPYYSFRSVNIDSSNVYMIITLNSKVECQAQLHFQTVSEPFFGNKKFRLQPVSVGYNELMFVINSPSLNGNFRFDPIMCEGDIEVYNTTLYQL